MLLIDHLVRFVGYGHPSAKTWFIGIEEAAPDVTSLQPRIQFGAYEDLASAHQKLGITQFHQLPKPKIQRTWRGMCILALALEGKFKPNAQDIRLFQAQQLGRSHGSTFLTEILPVPKPKARKWPQTYARAFPNIKGYSDYERDYFPIRLRQIQRLLLQYRPKNIVCYGSLFRDQYKALFPDRHFIAEGPFEISISQAQSVTLCPHFTCRSMNRGIYDLAEKIADWTAADPVD